MVVTSFQKDFTLVAKIRGGGEERNYFTQEEVRELFLLMSYYINDSQFAIIQLYESCTADCLLYLYK